MKEKMDKAYQPQKFEDKIYKNWEKKGYFNPDNLDREGKPYFSIVLPPPNVTGTLHLGHAFMLAIEDAMTRYKRMKGFDAVWVPGTDHAAIATQNVVEKKIYKNSKKTRHDLGKEKFLKKVAEHVEESKSIIKNQVCKMGASLDWGREAYTLDGTRSKAVRKVFKMMFDDGLIYRGDRIVNWCPRCNSTLADDEVIYKEQKAKLYYFKYSKDFPFTIATTRPETKLGDTAVAVNPDDQRYQKYIGQVFEVNFVGVPLKIKIIADKEVDPDFGAGALGVTPAHSAVDYQMAQDHDLEIIKIINEAGRITDKADKYKGLTVEEARKAVIEELEKQGLMEKIEEIDNNLSVCYRCKTPIQPLTSKQWFVDVNKKVEKLGMSVKEKSLQVVRDGSIKFIPHRFDKIYFNWMENLHDWCISRQIWFGHQIPVWYCLDCNEIIVAEDEPKHCPKCHKQNLQQDPDTLDTWFSSGLWTFTTLLNKNFTDFSKENNPDLKRFHPTTVLETGYDILFFWIARMILMTTYVMEEVPFANVYLHGIIRDKEGDKMSKSKPETAIDPLDAGKKFGFDALRLSMLIGSSPGNDICLYDEKIEGFRNLVNKLWNISRYILDNANVRMGTNDININNVSKIDTTNFTLADKWILSDFNQIKKQVEKLMDEYQFSPAGELLREFMWNDLADWYLEISKVQIMDSDTNLRIANSKVVLMAILTDLLKLWHPFAPFVTEAVWKQIDKDKPLIISDWPQVDKQLIDEKAQKGFEMIKEVITKIRNLRSEYKVEPAKKIKALVKVKDKKLIEENLEIIKTLARLEKLEFVENKPDKSAAAVVENIEIYLPLADLIDFDKEKERLSKEVEDLKKYLQGLDKKLSNKEFVKNAPQQVVEAEKQKQTEVQEKLQKLEQQLQELQ